MTANRNRQPGPIRRRTVSEASDTQHSQPTFPITRTRKVSHQPITDADLAGPRIRKPRKTVGGPGEWSRSMYLPPTSAAMTAAWGYTKTERHA